MWANTKGSIVYALAAVLVRTIDPSGEEGLTELDVCEADDGNRFWRTRHLEAIHSVPIFSGVKGQPINDALEVFSGVLAHELEAMLNGNTHVLF